MVEKGDQVIDKKFNGIDAISDAAFSVTADIVRDRADVVGECFHLRLPHQMTERKSVDKDDRQPLRQATFCVIQCDSVEINFHAAPPFAESRKRYTSLRI